MSRSPGRPKQYDSETALEAAGHVFWTKGFSATSLDDLSAAMSMNRPSIYRAFGDKQGVYRKALAQFGARMEGAMRETLFAEADLRKGLVRFYRAAVEVYTVGPRPRGCLVMSTAVSAAPSYPEIQADLLAVVRTVDKKIQLRMQQAIKDGALPPSFDTRTRSMLAQSLLHSLSLRARAGETKAVLDRLIKGGVEAITTCS